MMSTAVWSRSMLLRSAIHLLLPARRPRDALTVPHHPLGSRRLDLEAHAPLRDTVVPRPYGAPWHPLPRRRDPRGRCGAQALLSRAAPLLYGVAPGHQGLRPPWALAA